TRETRLECFYQDSNHCLPVKDREVKRFTLSFHSLMSDVIMAPFARCTLRWPAALLAYWAVIYASPVIAERPQIVSVARSVCRGRRSGSACRFPGRLTTTQSQRLSTVLPASAPVSLPSSGRAGLPHRHSTFV